MRRFLAAVAVLSLAACASSLPPSASRPSALVLVEVSGGSPDAEAFVARFLSVLSDAGSRSVTDARLSGARLDVLRDPGSPEAVRFRSVHPGDGYLGFDLPPCFPAGRAAGIKCTATVTLLSPEGGLLTKFEASASNSTGYTADSATTAEAETSRAAGEKAARKLLSALSR
jgi:hypothetical protein